MSRYHYYVACTTLTYQNFVEIVTSDNTNCETCLNNLALIPGCNPSCYRHLSTYKMRSILLIYLIVSQIAPYKRECNAEHFLIANNHLKNMDRSPVSERDSTHVVGLSGSAYTPTTSIEGRSVAVVDAFRLLQSLIYHLIERIRGIQYKVDIHFIQPIVQFLRTGGRNEKYRKNDHIECDIETLGLPAYKLKKIYDILAKSVLHNDHLHKRANATQFNINPHLIYRYLAAADWSQKYNGRR